MTRKIRHTKVPKRIEYNWPVVLLSLFCRFLYYVNHVS